MNTAENINLGYACINTKLQSEKKTKKQERICVNRTCIARTFREKGKEYAMDLARKNLIDVLKVLEWNESNGVKLYRMSSDMFPHITNPEFIHDKNQKYAYSLDEFDDFFIEIGKYAKTHGHRLTFHPGQYNQIGAKCESVFEKTTCDLSVHAEILDRMGLGRDSVMVVHGGGSYGDKKKTMDRWTHQFFKLPENVRNRIVIENCERQYSYKDMLDMSERIRRPVVFDTHHHDCYHKLVEPLPCPSTFMDEIISTWTRCGVKPKFHVSEQAPEKRTGAHSDYVETIPAYLLEIAKHTEIDLMVEAKMKEQAVFKLKRKYF